MLLDRMMCIIIDSVSISTNLINVDIMRNVVLFQNRIKIVNSNIKDLSYRFFLLWCSDWQLKRSPKHMGDPDGVPVSWHIPAPALTVRGICAVNYWMEDPFSFSFLYIPLYHCAFHVSENRYSCFLKKEFPHSKKLTK